MDVEKVQKRPFIHRRNSEGTSTHFWKTPSLSTRNLGLQPLVPTEVHGLET